MQSKQRFLLACWLTFLLCIVSTVEARLERLPESLQSWVEWTLYGHESRFCPTLLQSQEPLCAWTTEADLKFQTHTPAGAELSFSTVMFTAGWFFLPGDGDYWPRFVQDQEGKPLPIIARPEGPAVWLRPGEHHLTAEWKWEEPPQPFKIPKTMGALNIQLDDEQFSVNRDPSGLWLLKKNAATSQNQASVQIFRRFIDGFPFLVETLVQLQVSGTGRPLRVEAVVFPGSIVQEVESTLSLQSAPEGALDVQLIPGDWSIRVVSRFPYPVLSLTVPSQEEIWAFTADPGLRAVALSGLQALDPQTTTVPPHWEKYPVYRANLGEQLVLTEQPSKMLKPDALELSRRLWFDNQEKQWIVEEQIEGSLALPLRINRNPPFVLGSASIEGVLERITYSKQGKSGVQVHQLPLRLQTVSQVPFNGGELAATGWDRTFQKVKTRMYLPPGMRLIAIEGAEKTEGSWLSLWDFVDILMVLGLSFATAKLLGWGWGFLAGFALFLGYQETYALQYSWIWLLGCMALLRVVKGSGRGYVVGALWGGRLWILGAFVLFAGDAVKAIYYPEIQAPMVSQEVVREQVLHQESDRLLKQAPMMLSAQKSDSIEKNAPVRVTPQEGRGTGPALPEWTGFEYGVELAEPVSPEQTLQVWLLAPWMTGLWRIVAVMATAGLVYGFWRNTGKLAVVMICLLFLGGVSQEVSADIPDQALQEELQKRLLEPPPCFPNCVQIASLQGKIEGEQFFLELEVHAGAPSVLPIAKNTPYWLPANIRVNHTKGATRFDEAQQLLVAVPEGVSTVRLEGSVEGLQRVVLWLPLVPKQEQWSLGTSWQITKDRHLERIETKEGNVVKDVLIAPLIRVERNFFLDKEWKVQTEVTRQASLSGTFHIKYPLLEMEQVVTPGFKREGNDLVLEFQDQQEHIRWGSYLPITEEWSMVAPDDPTIIQAWNVQSSALWSFETAGLQPKQSTLEGSLVLQFRPWPTQALTLRVQETKLVPEKTYTIERYELHQQLGAKQNTYVATLLVHSSISQEHVFEYPSTMEIVSVLCDGAEQVKYVADKGLRLFLSPGRQLFQVTLQEKKEGAFFARIGGWPLSEVAYNIHLHQELPADRFVIGVHGPSRGPALVYWGLVGGLLLLSLLLSRLPYAPLNAMQWFFLGMGFVGIWPLGYVVLVTWFFAVQLCPYGFSMLPPASWRTLQCVLLFLTISAVFVLWKVIVLGLLGNPLMVVQGQGSMAHFLQWYQASSVHTLPQACSWSLPVWSYQCAMLVWALGIGLGLWSWIPWAWRCFTGKEKSVFAKSAEDVLA